MCGISGVVEAEGSPSRELLERMGQRIAHRGPDDGRVEVFGRAGFSFRRLSIIDVAGGGQPISNETGRIHVMANGEIYNYLDLRRELESLGHRFKTHSDVETLVHGYEQWGDDVPKHLSGMFAFAIWDEDRQRLLLGRDRLGKKPLLYAEAAGRLTFGSEFSAVLADPRVSRDVDRMAIHDYLTYQYVPTPSSGFKAIRKLEPAHVLVFEGGAARTTRYWQPSCTPRLDLSLDDAVAETERRLKESVRKRLMSEVPLGAFLSGGVDSSLIVALMSEFTQVKTFSIGFEESGFNELPHARAVAERYGTDHHEFVVKSNAAEVLPKLVRHYGEPYADSSALPSYYLAKLTREHVTVALNGDGGDEFFAGYDRYRALQYFKLARFLMPLAPVARALSHWRVLPLRARRAFAGAGHDPREAYARLMSYFSPEQKCFIYSDEMRNEVNARDSFDWMYEFMRESGEPLGIRLLQYSDAMTYLPGDILTKVDIATMANSLEGRSPLLDHELVEWALRLPQTIMTGRTEGKLVLKTLARKYLPASVIDRPKMGFGIPINDWFAGELQPMARETLLSRRARDRGLFDPIQVERLISDHASGREVHGYRLWALLCLELWFCEVVNGR
ncbi:MAG: asparagine synthase (glutamine-hydrolyzing) [Vicinamibacteria bacterium]|nr:asparagine synthase (glutamine-hydrolyzing) [Vicinamibacteria bacterium]